MFDDTIAMCLVICATNWLATLHRQGCVGELHEGCARMETSSPHRLFLDGEVLTKN